MCCETKSNEHPQKKDDENAQSWARCANFILTLISNVDTCYLFLPWNLSLVFHKNASATSVARFYLHLCLPVFFVLSAFLFVMSKAAYNWCHHYKMCCSSMYKQYRNTIHSFSYSIIYLFSFNNRQICDFKMIRHKHYSTSILYRKWPWTFLILFTFRLE